MVVATDTNAARGWRCGGRPSWRTSSVVVCPQSGRVIGRSECRYVEDRRFIVRDCQRRDRRDRRHQPGEVLARVTRQPQAACSRPTAVTCDIKTVVVIGDESDLRVVDGGKQVAAAER